jgi:hypothetical protein
MAPKRINFIGSGVIHGPKAYKLIGFGDIHGTKAYKFTGFGDIPGPKPYKFSGLVTSTKAYHFFKSLVTSMAPKRINL